MTTFLQPKGQESGKASINHPTSLLLSSHRLQVLNFEGLLVAWSVRERLRMIRASAVQESNATPEDEESSGRLQIRNLDRYDYLDPQNM